MDSFIIAHTIEYIFIGDGGYSLLYEVPTMNPRSGFVIGQNPLEHSGAARKRESAMVVESVFFGGLLQQLQE